MKKNKLLLGLLLISSSMLFGQSFLGGHFSTKDAILSNSLNPAAGIAGEDERSARGRCGGAGKAAGEVGRADVEAAGNDRGAGAGEDSRGKKICFPKESAGD